MKTRTLLLLAVACGLVILVAGSVKVFLIADDDPPAHLSLGQSGKVGDMRVTLRSAAIAENALIVTVELGGAADDDGGRAFVYNAGSGDVQPAPAAAEGDCGATTAASTVTCRLVFPTARVPGVLRYERAGATLRWDVAA